MAKSEKKIKPPKGKKAKKGFVLSVGDEGAILTHFDKGILLNRVFVDSPFSPDIKLMKKLFDLYPSLPISIYVDIIEQNYTHANLPPLSASAVKKQAQRKLQRDFQPNDLSNFVPLGREKEGRKDWKYLFISLANAEPFSNWIELVMEQKNKLNGIFVLAIESQNLINELNSKLPDKPTQQWEIAVMHNKVSGFRITAYKDKKVYFTRLTQHVIGENVAEVVAGNLEQEITNTIEYLKRLGFSGEKDAHLSIIANEDILKKIELSRMSFARVDKYTPYNAAEKLNITYAVKEGDKYADILCATHFANSKKPILKFSSKTTKEVILLQNAISAVYIFGFLALISILLMLGLLLMDRPEKLKAYEAADLKVKETSITLEKLKERQKSLPKDIDRKVSFLSIYNKLPKMTGLVRLNLYKATNNFPDTVQVKKMSIDFADFSAKDSTPQGQYSESFVNQGAFFNNPFNDSAESEPTKLSENIEITHSFQGVITIDLSVRRSEMDIINEISENLLESLKKDTEGIEFSYKLEPKAIQSSGAEEITDSEDEKLNEIILIPAEIQFKGTISEEKNSN